MQRHDGPLDVAEYSVLLCHSTHGRCYSSREIEVLLARTGFEVHGSEGSLVARDVMTQQPIGEVVLRTAAGEEVLPVVPEKLYDRAVRLFHGAVRGEGQPAASLAIAIKAEQRLCHRYRRLCARQKPKPLVIATVARELVGFIWAMLQLSEAQAS